MNPQLTKRHIVGQGIFVVFHMDMEVERKTWMAQSFQTAECLENMHSDIVLLEDLQKDNT